MTGIENVPQEINNETLNSIVEEIFGGGQPPSTLTELQQSLVAQASARGLDTNRLEQEFMLFLHDAAARSLGH